MNTYDPHSSAALYAVGALPDIARAAFEEHLQDCEDCVIETRSFEAATAELAMLVQRQPPTELRASILDAVSQTRQRRPVVTTVASQRSKRQVMKYLAAAAAVVVAAVIGFQGLRDEPAAPPQMSAAEQVMTASDAQRMQQTMDGAEITLVRSKSQKQAVLMTARMPPAPQGRDYQVWLDMPGVGMVSAGMMPKNGTEVPVMLKGDAAKATGAGITLEPAGGSTQPTTDPMVVFSFS